MRELREVLAGSIVMTIANWHPQFWRYLGEGRCEPLKLSSATGEKLPCLESAGEPLLWPLGTNVFVLERDRLLAVKPVDGFAGLSITGEEKRLRREKVLELD